MNYYNSTKVRGSCRGKVHNTRARKALQCVDGRYGCKHTLAEN